MSLTVKHLNADTTFLLTFDPDEGDSAYRDHKSSPSFTILVDPWLVGPSVIGHRWFVSSEHSVQPCINHLSQLDQEPDLVIVSQDNPDHCHESTLCQLPRKSSKTSIVAVPKAAETIQNFDHFHRTKIVAIPEYSPKRPESILHFSINPLTQTGEAGEVTIALVPARDLAGVHNAIGIKYLAPTAGPCSEPFSTINLPPRDPPIHGVLQPAQDLSGKREGADKRVPSEPISSPTNIVPNPKTSPNLRSSIMSKPTLSLRPRSHKQSQRQNDFSVEIPPLARESLTATAPTASSSHLPSLKCKNGDSTSHASPICSPEAHPPSLDLPSGSPSTPMVESPSSTNRVSQAETSTEFTTFSSAPSTAAAEVYQSASSRRPAPISILYTPHGLPASPALDKFISNYLHIDTNTSASQPLTLLIHAFHCVQNPWYLGGNIIAGANRGGVTLAKKLRAKCWIGAHDEEKITGGVVSKFVKIEKGMVGDIRRIVREGGVECDVRELGVGEEIILKG
ncbi:hypothetical protein PAAG_01073 [Paracoccidioides lutzii Pb01]|uniref:Uncharacterized protein n=1 Tax=Paracoccidioides lutzii (strain ATCC MYA-826 / Pb01) TaxID=502779 RepID=C1GRC8_PARBA|nr:hypothetical protein PAAG_01073 [Paracoccidioides lutzii Pb01]EEH38152.2 hypothetical protein PAAG_01073 [Paracoccidioides lutzii Pb01]